MARVASVRTRAERQPGDGWAIRGSKTWITHAFRADLMTVLCRTSPEVPGYGGLSMMLEAKTCGTADNAFPDQGLDGSEIEVLGYRDMKEYVLSYDGFAVAEEGLLGGGEGQGGLAAVFERVA